MVCISGFVFLYAILIGIFVPAALGNYAAKGEVAAGFRFGEVYGLVKAAPAAYLMVLLGGFLTSLISSLGVIACVIGVFFTIVYAGAVNAHLAGQAYSEAHLVLSGHSDELDDIKLASK